MDSIGPVGELSLATGSNHRCTHAYTDCYSDAHPTHADSHTNTNRHSDFDTNLHSRTPRLFKAA
jgi:hypothetical protein